jgi:hypothetical protein
MGHDRVTGGRVCDEPATTAVGALMARVVAGETGACERTVLKRMRGERVRGVIADKVDSALLARGVKPGDARLFGRGAA